MATRATRPARERRLRSAAPSRFASAAPVSVPVDGPHIRLGLAWALVTHVAAAAGPVPLAMVITPVAALAAVQAARSWRRRRRRAAVPVSGAGAALVAGASIFGIGAVGAAVVLVGCVLTAARLLAPEGARASPGLTGVIAVVFGVAGAALVLLRAEAFIPVFVLLSFVQVYDASAYVVGAGAGSRWEGPAAGVASIAAVTLAVAAVLSPPFRGATPWLLGLLAAVLAPVGPLAAAELIGDRRARVPAVLRLDSLLVLGPVWALAAFLSLD